jgi:hypothetical protein
MTKPINRMTKTLIVIFGITILLTACKDDNEHFEVEQNRKITFISLSEFSNKINPNQEKYNKLQSYFEQNQYESSSVQNRSAIDSTSNITILTDVITSIQEEGYTFYTFKVVTVTDDNTFHNLIVSVDDQQNIIDSKFLEYRPSDNWLVDTSQPFSGYVELIDNDFLSLDNLFASRATQWCAYGVNYGWRCRDGNEHSPDDCSPQGPCYVCGAQYYINVLTRPCIGSVVPGGIPISEESDDDLPQGGGGGTSGTPTIPTIPCRSGSQETDANGNCFDEDALTIENCIGTAEGLNSLNSLQKATLANYISTNGCSEETTNTILAVLEIGCMSNGNINSWTNNLEENEEPKWGQLANKQEILNEINNIDGLNDMSYQEQITALANHFEYNLMYDRDDNNNGELIQINNLDPNALNNYSNDNPNDFLPISKDVNRYIYSEVGGWIDFHHVFKIFEWATQNGPFSAITGGEMGELIQSVKDNESAYSYEDLPSNLLGVAMYVRFSQDLAQGNITWYQAVETTLNEISCLEPEEAPNFDYIPHIIDEHYPQNFTYSPLLGEQLRAYHKSKFCERSISSQIKIKEAHEKFPR